MGIKYTRETNENIKMYDQPVSNMLLKKNIYILAFLRVHQTDFDIGTVKGFKI